MLEFRRIGDVDVMRVPGGWLMRTHHAEPIYVPDPRVRNQNSNGPAAREAADLDELLDSILRKGRENAR
jgi:hypothetical protein